MATTGSLAAAEVAAQWHDGSVVFPDDGRRFATRGGTHGTNSLGFHERELPFAPGPGMRRIVVLGDSMTWGTTTAEEAWTRAAEAALGAPWQLVNLSHYGYDAEQSLATLHRFGWEYQPELVVFASYVNDLVPTELITVGEPPMPAWVAPTGTLPWSVRRWSALARLAEGAIRSAGFVERESSDTYRDVLLRMRDESAGHGVPLLILGLAPHVLAEADLVACDVLAGAPGRCETSMRRLKDQETIALELGIRFAPMVEALRPAPPGGWFPANVADWEHPSPAGHERIGKVAAGVIGGFVR
ncbi:hypothetical protein LBMAG42_39550 [Deltaproteobacteria bacterium]|nr:hypothetical protein LBMAG42_39550 [Deltaproteobacteria bacterium]